MSDSFDGSGLDAVPVRAAEAAEALERLKEPAEAAASAIETAFSEAGESLARSLARAAADGEISLAELARTVFSAFQADDLLRLGARPEPAEENFATVLARHPLLPEGAYRPALPAIVDYLKDCGVRPLE